MLRSHQSPLDRARGVGEPAGQVAARELAVQRLSGPLRRADELDDDVAATIAAAEAEQDGCRERACWLC